MRVRAARRVATRKETSGESASAMPFQSLRPSIRFLGARIFWRVRFGRRGQLIREEDVRVAVGVGLHLEHVGGAEIVFVVQQVVDARGAIGLFPAIGEVRLVGGADDFGVGGDDQAAVGIQSLRKLIEGDVAGPFVVVGVAGNGNFAVAFLADGDAGGHDVADVAFDVGVDGVLRRSPDVFHDAAKLFPVLRFAEHGVGVGEAAGFGGGPAQSVGFVGFATNDGAVASGNDAEMLVGSILDVDDFVEDLGLLPFLVDAIFVGRGGVECSRCRDPERRRRCW